MNYQKTNNANTSIPSSASKYQNKNLNTSAKPTFTNTRDRSNGNNKLAVVYGRQNLGKTIGAAATPAAPTPLNTPSLKKENNGKDSTTTLTTPVSTSTVWGSHQSSNDSKSADDSNKPVSAKPAPWAKVSSGSSAQADSVTTTTTSNITRTPLKTWAAEDEEEEEEDRDSPQAPHSGSAWPDNFRDNAQNIGDDHDNNERGYDGPPHGRFRGDMQRPRGGSHDFEQPYRNYRGNDRFHNPPGDNRYPPRGGHMSGGFDRDYDGPRHFRNNRDEFHSNDRYNNRGQDYDPSRQQHRYGDNDRGGDGGYNRRFNGPNNTSSSTPYSVNGRVAAFKPGPPSSFPNSYDDRRPNEMGQNDRISDSFASAARERSRTLSGDYTNRPSAFLSEGNNDMRGNMRGNLYDRRKPGGYPEDPETKAIEASRYEAELLESRKRLMSQEIKDERSGVDAQQRDREQEQRGWNDRNTGYNRPPNSGFGGGFRGRNPNEGPSSGERDVWERVKLPPPPPVEAIKRSPGVPIATKSFSESREFEFKKDDMLPITEAEKDDRQSFIPSKVLTKPSQQLEGNKSFAGLFPKPSTEAKEENIVPDSKLGTTQSEPSDENVAEDIEGVVVPAGQEFTRNEGNDLRKKLYDPKINQLVDLPTSTENKTGKLRGPPKDEKERIPNKAEKPMDKRKERNRQEPTENTTRWEKVLLQNTKDTKKLSNDDQSSATEKKDVVDARESEPTTNVGAVSSSQASESIPVSLENDVQKKKKEAQEEKQREREEKMKAIELEKQARFELRRKESESRGPRTKGELYRYNEAGEIVRVLTEEEKSKLHYEQENQEKSDSKVPRSKDARDSVSVKEEKHVEEVSETMEKKSEISENKSKGKEATEKVIEKVEKSTATNKSKTTDSKEMKEIKSVGVGAKPVSAPVPPKVPIAPPTKAWIAPKSTLEVIGAIPTTASSAPLPAKKTTEDLPSETKPESSVEVRSKIPADKNIHTNIPDLLPSKEVDFLPQLTETKVEVVESSSQPALAAPPALSLAKPVVPDVSPVHSSSSSQSSSSFDKLSKELKELTLEEKSETKVPQLITPTTTILPEGKETSGPEVKLLDPSSNSLIQSPSLQGLAGVNQPVGIPINNTIAPAMMMNMHSNNLMSNNTQLPPSMKSFQGISGEDPNLFGTMKQLIGMNVPSLAPTWQSGMGLTQDTSFDLRQSHLHQPHLTWPGREDANKIMMHDHGLNQLVGSPAVNAHTIHHMDPYSGFGNTFPNLLPQHANPMLQDPHANPWAYSFAMTDGGLYYPTQASYIDPRHSHLLDSSYLGGMHDLNRQSAAVGFSPFGGLQHPSNSLMMTQQLQSQQQLSQAMPQTISMMNPNAEMMNMSEFHDLNSGDADKNHSNNRNNRFGTGNSINNNLNSNMSGAGNNDYFKRDLSQTAQPVRNANNNTNNIGGNNLNNNVSLNRNALPSTNSSPAAFTLNMMPNSTVMGMDSNVAALAQANALMGGNGGGLHTIPFDINMLYAQQMMPGRGMVQTAPLMQASHGGLLPLQVMGSNLSAPLAQHHPTLQHSQQVAGIAAHPVSIPSPPPNNNNPATGASIAHSASSIANPAAQISSAGAAVVASPVPSNSSVLPSPPSVSANHHISSSATVSSTSSTGSSTIASTINTTTQSTSSIDHNAPKLQIAPTLPVSINDGEKYTGGRSITNNATTANNNSGNNGNNSNNISMNNISNNRRNQPSTNSNIINNIQNRNIAPNRRSVDDRRTDGVISDNNREYDHQESPPMHAHTVHTTPNTSGVEFATAPFASSPSLEAERVIESDKKQTDGQQEQRRNNNKSGFRNGRGNGKEERIVSQDAREFAQQQNQPALTQSSQSRPPRRFEAGPPAIPNYPTRPANSRQHQNNNPDVMTQKTNTVDALPSKPSVGNAGGVIVTAVPPTGANVTVVPPVLHTPSTAPVMHTPQGESNGGRTYGSRNNNGGDRNDRNRRDRYENKYPSRGPPANGPPAVPITPSQVSAPTAQPQAQANTNNRAGERDFENRNTSTGRGSYGRNNNTGRGYGGRGRFGSARSPSDAPSTSDANSK